MSGHPANVAAGVVVFGGLLAYILWITPAVGPFTASSIALTPTATQTSGLVPRVATYSTHAASGGTVGLDQMARDLQILVAAGFTIQTSSSDHQGHTTVILEHRTGLTDTQLKHIEHTFPIYVRKSPPTPGRVAFA